MKELFKLIACCVTFVVAQMCGGILTSWLHLHFPPPPANTNTSTQAQMLALWVSGAVLALGLYPLARGLAAPVAVRILALCGFYFVALGVNGVIETRFFTHMMDHGVAAMEVLYATGAILFCGALGWLFGEKGEPAGLARHGWAGWIVRGITAWLGWPVTYFVFGVCVAPFVLPYYTSGVIGLQLPPMSTVFGVQMIRSLVFLAASLPFIALWKGSRRGLWLALGSAHAVVVGLYGMISATFLPTILRVAHGIEMTADAFAYACLLVLLFWTRRVSASVPAAVQLAAEPRGL